MKSPEPSTLEPRREAERLRDQALPFLARGAFVDALALYDRALTLAQATRDRSFVDWIVACRAAAAIEVGDVDAVLVDLKQILLRRSADPQTSVRAAYSTARGHELGGDVRKALFYNQIALRDAIGAEDLYLRTLAERQRGMLLVVESRFAEAADCFRHVLASPSSLGYPTLSETLLVAEPKNELGYCLISLDHVSEGLRLVHEALDMTAGAEHETGTAVWMLMDLCFGYLKLDRHGEARYFGEQALERSAGDRAMERRLLYLLGEACHLGGDRASAGEYWDRLSAEYPHFPNLRSYLQVLDFRNVINLRGL